jgi:peroxiredoxin
MKLRMPVVGELAPNFNLSATTGNPIELAKLSHQTVLIFMRHLA